MHSLKICRIFGYTKQLKHKAMKLFENVINELDKNILSLNECLKNWPENSKVEYSEALKDRNAKLKEFKLAKDIILSYQKSNEDGPY